MQAAPPAPASEQLVCCTAGIDTLRHAMMLHGMAQLPLSYEQVLLVAVAEPFLFGSWQRMVGVLAATTADASQAAAAASVLLDVWSLIQLIGLLLGDPAHSQSEIPQRSALAAKAVPWLAPAVQTAIKLAEDHGRSACMQRPAMHLNARST